MEPAEPSNSTPKLSLFSMPSIMQSPERSGMLTPPLFTSASVPFRWEEEPGKPRPCTTLIPFSNESPKCLDLPPNRLFLEPIKISKTPSPPTVLEGPYVLGRPKLISSSFRFFGEQQSQGSFDSSSSRSPDGGGQLSDIVLGKKLHKGRGSGGLFGSWRSAGTPKLKEVGGSSRSFVHPSSVDSVDIGSDEGTRKRRNGSFSSLSQARPHFWAAVYEGFKQVITWKSRKSKKGLA
ncbi:hypothetical protein ACH5RR_024212 [Cinchona calisaya]|uniref:Uncharacterized protein n=1 Tax=Cinchona calisaya TaxID=153742 RepID=A0ABD2ZCV3_9GENT